MNKSILTSKTFWVQVVTFLSVFVPAVQEWLASNPEQFLGALAAVNVLVRFATKGKVTLFGEQMNLIAAFISACNAFVAWVNWRLATDLDNDEDELDRLGKLMESKPSADTQLRILRLRQRIQRKKRQSGIGEPTVGNNEAR